MNRSNHIDRFFLQTHSLPLRLPRWRATYRIRNCSVISKLHPSAPFIILDELVSFLLLELAVRSICLDASTILDIRIHHTSLQPTALLSTNALLSDDPGLLIKRCKNE